MLTANKSHCEEIITQLRSELQKLRTSRATPSLVEDVFVEVYGGSRMTLKELASISVPEPRMIVIRPWDKNIIKDIEKSLIKSEFEFNPIVETDVLRIQLPELTQETRERLVKKLHGILENTRIKLRKARDETKKNIEGKARSGDIPEDDKFHFIEELNKMTKLYTDTIDDMGKKKEEEIMTV